MTMRLRDPKNGTVVSVGDASAKRLQAAGWKPADSSTSSTLSAQDVSDDGGESAPKPKRRSSTRRSE